MSNLLDGEKSQTGSRGVLKRCCHCKQELPLTEFCRNRCAADGFQARCKSCHRDAVYATRARRGRVASEAASEAQRAACRRWYAANADIRKQYHRSRREIITDGYAAESLGLRLADIPPPLLEAQRVRLRITREMRKAKQ